MRDALSRKTSEGGPQGTATYVYDLASRQTQLTWPGAGLFVNYDYLVTGEVQKIRENGAVSGVGVLATYGYDNLGNRASATLGNGAVQAYGYDLVSRLTSLSNDLTGTTNDLSVTFAYNPASQITTAVRTGDAYAFTAIGSGATAYAQNGLNQQITIGGASATWDSKGNLHFDPTSGTSYCYSSENLLTGTGATCSPPSTALAYDPALRLYQVAGAATTRFAYTGADAIADYDGSNALQHRYVLDPSTGQPLVQYDGSGTATRKFLSTDERGSVISQTDSAGALIGINSYDEYGRPGAANLGRYQYTGQKWIGEAGLYDYKARDYLPHLGIFAQTDPAGGMNLYAYTGGEPINFVDPTGFDKKVNNPKDTLTGTRIPGGISPGLFGNISYPQGYGSASSGGSAAGGGGGGGVVIGQVTETEWTSIPSGATSYTYSYSFVGDSFGAGFQFASFGGSNEENSLDDIVITAWRTHRLAGVAINYSIGSFDYPQEQLWGVLQGNNIRYLGIFGGRPGRGNDVRFTAPNAGYIAIIHTHPWTWSLPTPGGEDFGHSFPVYGLTDEGAWVVRPNSGSPATCLVGRC